MSRVKMTDYEEHEFALGQTYLSSGSWVGQGSSFRESTFRSPHGIVEVYEMVGRRSITSMRFIHQGRDHMRRWETSWGDKTLARLAREFVEDVIGA